MTGSGVVSGLLGNETFRLLLRPSAVLSRSVVSDSATPWTVARQALLSVGFSRQEDWSGVPCPPNPGIEPRSPTVQANSLPSEPPGKPLHMVDTQ